MAKYNQDFVFGIKSKMPTRHPKRDIQQTVVHGSRVQEKVDIEIQI